ncbi:SDR family oxidoreductase [Marinoscillum sp. MHG1-6]|uniref:SDR family oxidoreductase n=1 Tax=Marinoscillum sp. MHG1-6 TaxID=2959627 RepID=UPI0021578DB0|nr:SDR family oxidoreductase [Marinoscillum sp. MHG1-6]
MKKYAIIIGGSSGIGLASAKKLGQEGFGLVIVHRDRRSTMQVFEAEVNELKAANIEVHTYNIDGTNKEKVIAACETFKQDLPNVQFSVMLHSLSRGNLKKLISDGEPELSEEDIHLTIDAMAINALTWVKALTGNQLMAKGGRVITLTSAGSQKYWSGYAAVAIAKSSLEILTKYLAVELAGHDLRANAINAGITDTPSLKFIPGYDDLVKEATRKNPLGRMTQPEDVANVVYLLSRPEANWINGSIINVDGGETLI